MERKFKIWRGNAEKGDLVESKFDELLKSAGLVEQGTFELDNDEKGDLKTNLKEEDLKREDFWLLTISPKGIWKTKRLKDIRKKGEEGELRVEILTPKSGETFKVGGSIKLEAHITGGSEPYHDHEKAYLFYFKDQAMK